MKVGFYLQATEYLGVEYLSAVLKQAGHTTEAFFDPRIWRDGYLHQPTLAKWFNVEDMVVEEMLRADLDVICFTTVTDNYATALRVAQKVKDKTNIPTVFGGIHCTSVPERVAVKPQVDYVVVGEGEYPLLELVEALERGERNVQIPNVWHKQLGELANTPTRPVISDLDTLPFPDKDLFFEKAPRFHRKRYVTAASRGCVYACTFCNNSMYKTMYNKEKKGKWHRRRSVDNLIEELKLARDKYNYKEVFFWDEIFVDNREWLEEFCEKYGAEIGLPFWCYGYARYINQEVVDMLEAAGCREMNIGVQSISPATRKIIKRGDRNEKIEQAIEILDKSKIFLTTGNILQLPGQPLEEALELAAFYNENRVGLPIVGFLRYYPRTEVVDTGLKHGTLKPEDIDRIEEAEEELPFTVASHRDSADYAKIQTLIQLTIWAPRFLVPWLIRTGRWKWLPHGVHVTLVLSALAHVRNLKTGKYHSEENYTTFWFLWMMAKYGSDKILWKLRKRFQSPSRTEGAKTQEAV